MRFGIILTVTKYIPGIAGFFTGISITCMLKMLLLPETTELPKLRENRKWYGLFLRQNNFHYKPFVKVDVDHGHIISEHKLLQQMEPVLCYIVERMTDIDIMSSILQNWAADCDETIVFHKNQQLRQKVTAGGNTIESNIKFISLNSKNDSTASTLAYLRTYSNDYKWFVYVPQEVFLIPENLRYFLVATEARQLQTEYIGLVHTNSILGHVSISEQAPLIMSALALEKVASMETCRHRPAIDISCVVNTNMCNVRQIVDSAGNDVMVSAHFSEWFSHHPGDDISQSVKTRYPVSIHVQGSLQYFDDMQWYIKHLSTYGIEPFKGSFFYTSK